MAERFIISVGHGLKRTPPCRIFNGAHPCATSYQRTEPLNPSIIATAAKPPRPVDGVAPETDLLVRTILDSLDDAKAEDVVAIDLRGKTSLADTMVVATGRSSTHVGAIADRLLRQCKSAGTSTRVEGLSNCDWVLVDAGDAIIHIFRPEVRQFYNLEKMWGGLRPDEQQQHAG